MTSRLGGGTGIGKQLKFISDRKDIKHEKRMIHRQEVELHCKEDDCWLILGSNVYDVTPYLAVHPGGRETILECAGRDATKAFEGVHPWVSHDSILESCKMGTVSDDRGGLLHEILRVLSLK